MVELKKIIFDFLKTQGLTESCIGTVKKINPLEILIDNTMQTIKSELLILSDGVIEKKFTLISHLHKIKAGELKHSHNFALAAPNGSVTGTILDALPKEYSTVDNEKQIEDFSSFLHDEELPILDEEYIIINPALAVDDKVLLLQVQKGQRYIILSRLFKDDK